MSFPCNCCGACCRDLDRSPLYADLHDGDGVCRYLRGNLCSIYDHRPLLCRVDECYEIFFKQTMSYEEYVQLNLTACASLKTQEKETKKCLYH